MRPTNTRETIETRRQRLSSIPRACEGCKIRKIRCDRTTPCANCQAAEIACRQANEKTKGQIQSDKIDNLQALVARLEDRLQAVEAELDTLKHSQLAPVTDALSSASCPVENTPILINPSFATQSFHASESVRSIYRGGLSNCSFFLRKSAVRLRSTPQPLPAMLVTCILRKMSVHRPVFLSSYAINDLSIVESLCQRVYSVSDIPSSGEIASMHGVFFFVLKELIAMKDPLSHRFDLATYLDHCEQNFVAAIESYEVIAVPNYENILALILGMIKAQGEANPYLYCKFASVAVTHCQELGYHCESTYHTMPHRKAESVRRLFWTLYTFDKNMSLVLGRASFMQGLKIDLQHPTVSVDPGLRAWDESFIMGIQLAELQGRIYTGLYSTISATTARAASDRDQFICDIALQMEIWHAKLKQINPEGVNTPEVFSLSRGNWEILFYSTLTLLFHAASAREGQLRISAQCFAAAQNSLRAHLDVFPRYQKSQLLSDGDYCNWILLSSSFVPFIVAFLHAVAIKDATIVTLLEDVLSTLQTFRTTSRGSESLYQICSTFTQAAKKITQPQQQQQNMSSVLETAQKTSLFDPAFFQDALEDSVETNFDTIDPAFASSILNDWLDGPPFPWDRLDTISGVSG